MATVMMDNSQMPHKYEISMDYSQMRRNRMATEFGGQNTNVDSIT